MFDICPPNFALFDKFVGQARARNPQATALQIGANDGQLYDPLYRHLQEGMPALLVEPHPEYYAALGGLHAHHPHIRLARTAVTNTVGVEQLYFVQSRAIQNGQLPARAQGFASFDKASITRPNHNIAGIEQHIARVAVATTTYDKLIQQYNIAPDIVVIDTEGSDDELVRAVINTPHHPLPAGILYEHEHLSREQSLLCQQDLRRAGYKLAYLRDDTLAYRPRVLEQGVQ